MMEYVKNMKKITFYFLILACKKICGKYETCEKYQGINRKYEGM